MCVTVRGEAGLRPGDFHTPEEARRELTALTAQIPSADAWKTHAAKVRAGILAGAGLDP
jgi:hypothetical protein